MATLIVGKNFHEVWDQLTQTLLIDGKICDPRGKPTLELLNVTVEVENSRSNILCNVGRSPNYRSMVAEWLWIMFGHRDVASIASYLPKYKEFSDDGKTLSGAYGPAVILGIIRCSAQLNLDQETRQALIPIWNQFQQIPSKDVPCTISIQFLYRYGKLHTIVNMRSSDVWLGLVYDFYVFSQIANVICALCKLRQGSLTFHLGSSHLYKENISQLEISKRHDSSSLLSPILEKPAPLLLDDAFINRDLELEREDFEDEVWFWYYKILRARTKLDAYRIMKDMEIVWG